MGRPCDDPWPNKQSQHQRNSYWKSYKKLYEYSIEQPRKGTGGINLLMTEQYIYETHQEIN